MISKLLTSSSAVGQKIGIGDAALDALIGYMVVFLGISFLILVVWAVGRIMMTANKSPREKQTKTKAIPPAEIKPVQSSEEEISEETLAVIMAALMAYYEANNPKCEFTVKRIKRI